MTAGSDRPRIALVGPARTNSGLGPYLARHLAAAGARVVAVAGRDRGRTTAAAAAMATDLGHEVAAEPSLQRLLDRADLDGVVIASPIPAHLEALQAAAARRLPVLCEKPLVHPRQHDAAEAVVADFRAHDVPLLENCQWPLTVPALRRLWPRLDPAAPVGEVVMRLSPAAGGFAMVLESLSHLLSLVQALLPNVPLAAADVVYTGGGESLTMRCRFRGGPQPLQATLHLRVHVPQPRPAWYSIDGCRVDRRIELPAYHWRLEAAGGGSQTIGDPQAAVVYSFVELISEPDVERTRKHAADIISRARLFRDICAAWVG